MVLLRDCMNGMNGTVYVQIPFCVRKNPNPLKNFFKSLLLLFTNIAGTLDVGGKRQKEM